MTTEIKTEIMIQASPQKIWDVLTDFEKYTLWNPFITSISGTPSIDERLTIVIHPPNAKKMTFKPMIINFAENKELRWCGKFLFTGLFDGEHYFHLKEKNDGTTQFVQGEKFSGLLVRLFGEKGLANTKLGFEKMNKALKAECEKC